MNYSNQDLRRGELVGFFGFGAALLAVLLLAWVAGCGSNIPIGEAPTCVDLVTDECVPEVVEEFCTPNAPCDERGAYRRGFAAGVVSVVPDECPVCEECTIGEDDDDSDAKPHKKPHRNTRGKGHEHHDGDRINLDSDDPLEGI